MNVSTRAVNHGGRVTIEVQGSSMHLSDDTFGTRLTKRGCDASGKCRRGALGLLTLVSHQRVQASQVQRALWAPEVEPAVRRRAHDRPTARRVLLAGKGPCDARLELPAPVKAGAAGRTARRLWIVQPLDQLLTNVWRRRALTILLIAAGLESKQATRDGDRHLRVIGVKRVLGQVLHWQLALVEFNGKAKRIADGAAKQAALDGLLQPHSLLLRKLLAHADLDGLLQIDDSTRARVR